MTSVTRSNALNHSMVSWDEVFEAVSRCGEPHRDYLGTSDMGDAVAEKLLEGL